MSPHKKGPHKKYSQTEITIESSHYDKQKLLRFDSLLRSFQILLCKVEEKTHNTLVLHTARAHSP